MTRSLKLTLLVGLMALGTFTVTGVAGVVYWRSHGLAHEAMRNDLVLRARTVAGVLAIEQEGYEYELPERALPEYWEPKSGVYATIHDHTGKVIISSPSLELQPLVPNAPWREGEFVFEELAEGPNGIPCATATYSFVARLDDEGEEDDDGDDDAGWVPPSEEERRYQARVAIDSRPRDAGLAGLAWFLAATCAGALAVLALGGFLLSRRVIGPVERMTADAKELTPRDETRRLAVDTVVRELQSLAAQFNLALDRQAEALESQRRFTADASHELRTPVSVLRGNAELLLRRKRSETEYREGLETQVRVATRMHEVIQNLLLLARSDSAGEGLRLEDVDLGALVASMCGEFAGLAKEKDVTLSCDADDDVVATCDRRAIQQLVQNLLSNALKFTPEGGSVDVAVATSAAHASIEVSDSGPGIPEDQRAKVFDRFYRVGNGSDQREGAGLGLAIVAWVARSHGGEVTVRDRPGGGTTFAVRIPTHRLAPRPAAREPAASLGS